MGIFLGIFLRGVFCKISAFLDTKRLFLARLDIIGHLLQFTIGFFRKHFNLYQILRKEVAFLTTHLHLL